VNNDSTRDVNDDTRDAVLAAAQAGDTAPADEPVAMTAGGRLAVLAGSLAVDVAVGLLWALLLAAAVLLVGGVSQFIYVAF
jgi:hypothetical protein